MRGDWVRGISTGAAVLSMFMMVLNHIEIPFELKAGRKMMRNAGCQSQTTYSAVRTPDAEAAGRFCPVNNYKGEVFVDAMFKAEP